MLKRGLGARLIRFVMTVAVGGAAFQLSGCDPSVRSTLLTGLESTAQSLSTALISAVFAGLQDNETTGTSSSLTTVTP